MSVKFNKTILYLDDDKQNLDVFYFTFRDLFKIYTTTSVVEAWNYLNTQPVKILISDQRMPEIGGLDFINQVHNNYPSIISILLTAYSDTDIMLDAINRVGIFCFILKPWQENEMIMTLQNAIEKYDLLHERIVLLKDLQKKNETLKIEKSRAEESTRLKAAFLANISHEIRTPINGIVGFSGLLLEDSLDREQKKEYSELVNNSCKNLLSILDDIILLSLLNAESFIPIETKCSLNILEYDIDEIGATLQAKYESPEISFKIRVLVENTPIQCQLDCIKNIMTKLIDNAFKYTPSGSIKVDIDIEECNGLKWLKISTTDTGLGIAKNLHEKIFGDFYQPTPELGKINSGNGIGLGIVKSLVKILNGNLILFSEPGRGSEFTVKIPVTIL